MHALLKDTVKRSIEGSHSSSCLLVADPNSSSDGTTTLCSSLFKDLEDVCVCKMGLFVDY